MTHPAKPHRLIIQWASGLLGSWLCVYAIAPMVVNSILVRVNDPDLNAVTLREGDLIRWRSEGWGDTHVGPHGLPGWRPNGSSQKVILWGDSQVEGFCVQDCDKLGAQCVQQAAIRSDQSIDFLPMARSGSDAVLWTKIVPEAEKLWKPALHVFVVTELSDLMVLASRDAETHSSGAWAYPSPPSIVAAKRLHADAMFQAVRKLVLDPQSGSLRSLRWSMGPVRFRQSLVAALPSTALQDEAVVCEKLIALAEQLNDRLAIVYAPAVPQLAEQPTAVHADDAAWERIKQKLSPALQLVDMREPMKALWFETGKLARGFHNGLPGQGHLNADGNRVIAISILDAMADCGLIEVPKQLATP